MNTENVEGKCLHRERLQLIEVSTLILPISHTKFVDVERGWSEENSCRQNRKECGAGRWRSYTILDIFFRLFEIDAARFGPTCIDVSTSVASLPMERWK